MRKTVVVAVREYQAAVRTRAFLITLLAMPILMGGSFIVQKYMSDRVDTTPKRIAVLDETGRLFDAVAEAAATRNRDQIFAPDGRQIRPTFIVEAAAGVPEDRQQAAFELSERVRQGAYFAFVLIGPDVIHPGNDPQRAAVAYHSNAPTYGDAIGWLSWVIGNEVREIRLREADLDPAVIAVATAPVAVDNLGLVSRGAAGEIVAAAKTSEVANFVVPFGLLMLMFMVVNVGATPLIQAVIEEKMQRIAEVLLGSVAPFELMLGKLLGVVGVGLTMATVYLVGAYVALNQAGYGQFFPSKLLFWFVVYQSLLVLMFGSIFVAAGAAVSDFREAQSLIMPVYIVMMVPLFVWMNVVKEPTSAFSTLVSLFPPATPMLMVVRQAVPPGIPLWQPVLGVVLVLLTTLGCVFVAGRIFRIGILMQGKAANLREMAGWVLRG